MQNRFGVKDFVLFLLVFLLLIMVGIGIKQDNRTWGLVSRLQGRADQQEQSISRLERQLHDSQESIRVSQDAMIELLSKGGGSGGGGAGSAQPLSDEEIARLKAAAAGNGPKGPRDESWARPGVPVQWQPEWTFFTDPREEQDFQAGGSFTEALEAQPAKIVPYLATDVYGTRVIDMVLESLGVYDANTLKMRGCLADAWQVDPEGLWVRVHIRENARFSDGVPVTAEDVEYTYKGFILNPLIEAERARSTIDSLEDVKVINTKTVEFVFNKRYFLNTDIALGTGVLPKHFYEKLTPAQINPSTGLLMGSGPYKLEQVSVRDQWSPPDPVKLVRNEQYWGAKPPVERMVFKTINDELARLTDYRNGDSDMMMPASAQFVKMTEETPGWNEHNYSLKWVNMRSGRGGIIWNCGPRGGPGGKLTPFHDKRVRQAMTMLLDRQKMIDDLSKGIGEVPTGFFNPGTPGDDPNLKPLPYDPKRAAELLREAGWWDRDGDRVLENEQGEEFTFELTYAGGGEIAERMATFIVDAYAAGGIRVVRRAMDWAVTDTVRNQRDFDAMTMGWGANAPESDPKQIFHSDSIANQGDNFGQWSSPEADAAIDAARSEMDPEKRAELWQKFTRIMHDEQPYTWTRVSPTLRFIKPDFGNINTYPKGLEPWEFYKRSGAPAAPEKM